MVDDFEVLLSEIEELLEMDVLAEPDGLVAMDELATVE